MGKQNFFILLPSMTLGILSGALSSDILAQSNSTVIGINNFPTKDQIKTIFVACFIGVVFIFFLMCMWIYSTSTDQKKLDFASQWIGNLVGFFTGAITGWLG